MYYPANKPMEYYLKRHWRVRDEEISQDTFNPPPEPYFDVLDCGRDFERQNEVLMLNFYIRSCPDGVDTHTFTTSDGKPDVAEADAFYDSVITKFANFAPAGFNIYTVREGHVVHLIAKDVCVREPGMEQLNARRQAQRQADAAKKAGYRPVLPLVMYLDRCWSPQRGEDTFTFLDQSGEPDPAAAQRFAAEMRQRVRAGIASSYIAVHVQCHLVHVHMSERTFSSSSLSRRSYAMMSLIPGAKGSGTMRDTTRKISNIRIR